MEEVLNSMCIGIPCRVIARVGELGTVEYCGNSREINFALVPQAGNGEWVLVHAGLALQLIGEDEAEQLLALLEEFYAERD